MNRFQTLRIVLLMLLLAAASVAAYLFFRHELYFCLLFSSVSYTHLTLPTILRV